MISSIPRPLYAPAERALYQMMCDLGEIAAAGWEFRILPTRAPYRLLIIFTPSRAIPVTAHPRGLPHTGDNRYTYPILRFALPSEMLRVTGEFHRRLFPVLPDRENPTPA